MHHLRRRDRRRRPPARRRAWAAATTSASRPSTSCWSRWTASATAQGVILIAATNRPDILDPALLRPGRFDRQIPVSSPDLAGRRAVLRVHSQGKPIAPDADLDGLAKRTVGMSGADLANVINEAALLDRPGERHRHHRLPRWRRPSTG